jgi:hypothetical protein
MLHYALSANERLVYGFTGPKSEQSDMICDTGDQRARSTCIEPLVTCPKCARRLALMRGRKH